MKIKHILPAFLIMLLPVGIMATDNKDLEMFCDNIIFNEMYNLYYGLDTNSYAFEYALGEKNNRGKYKYDVLEICDEKNACERALFGGKKVFGERSLLLNMPSYLLYFNNIEVFELLLKNHPEYKDFIDDGTYPDITYCNEEFTTPALNAVKEGQLGIVKYLVENYDVNLFKTAGYVYYNKNKPQRPLTVEEIADNAVTKWRDETPNADRLKCAVAMQKYVKQWQESHKDMKAKAKAYNEKAYKFASDPEYIMENITPFEFTPPQFTPSLNLFKLDLKEEYAQTIEKRIDTMIKKLMRDFDFSAFGNQA